VVSSKVYDVMYRWWAPWDGVGFRPELRRLLDAGEVTPATHPRAIDLGCGTGANVVELAARGFDATGVDFSPVALGKARERAAATGVEDRCRFLEVDLTAPALPAEIGGPYDLVLDFGTLDDLRASGRDAMASHMAALTRPDGVVLFYCFYARRSELPRVSFHGPSRMAPGLEPGDEQRLFAAAFEVRPFLQPDPFTACFLLRRRGAVERAAERRGTRPTRES
jgi:SAM-dependent methyltransferase